MAWHPCVTAPKIKAEKIELGRRLFSLHLRGLSSTDWPGTAERVSALAGSDFLNADKNRAIKIVINGRQGEVVVNGRNINNSMPKFPLGDEDIANVLTYVYNSFGNSGLEVQPGEVKRLRLEPPDKEGPKAVQQPSQYE